MDQSLVKALEMAVAGILLVVALTHFLGMHSAVMAYMNQGYMVAEREGAVQVYEGTLSEKGLSKAEILWLLTDKSMQPDSQAGGSMYGTPKISVYIDGVYYPPVNDYDGVRALRGSLMSLVSEEYDVTYVVDTSGETEQIHLDGR